MVAKIDTNGFLAIERASRWKAQDCPYAGSDTDGDSVRCGDWCPLFVEQEVSELHDSKETHLEVVLGCARNFPRNLIKIDERPLQK